MQDMVRAKFDQWKKQLFDLSARNRLLYFRPTRRGSLAIKDVSVDTLYDTLVKKGLQIIFEGKPEEDQAGEQLFPDHAEQPVSTQQDGSIRLRTTVPEKDLKRRLTNLYHRARESLLEQGIHTLYMALGFLEWYEAEHSNTPIRSPLLLIPVELERQRGGVFALTPKSDPPETNVVLAEKLRRDLLVQLPDWDKGEEGNGDLATYLEQVRSATAHLERSSVQPDAVLDIFSFAKFVMYRDLEQHTDRAMGNKLVRALCGAPWEEPDHGVPSGVELDERIGYAECFHVLDADTSQREAIAAASMGESFILVGPPGTGKSQTIANIIAECIAKGKKVLFVSEKAAALEVVYRRLEDVRLHPFCLVLHSARGTKREVLDQLRDAVEFSGDAGQPTGDFWAVEKRRRELNAYAKALHEPFGALGWTPFEVHGKLARLQNVPTLSIPINPVTSSEAAQKRAVSDASGRQGGLATVDRQLYAEMERVMGDIKRLADFFKRGQGHPWWGYRYKVEFADERQQQRDALVKLQEVADNATDLCAEFDEAWGLDLPKTIDGLVQRVEVCEVLLQTDGRTLETAWLGAPSLAEHSRRAEEAASVSADVAAASALWSRYSEALQEIDAEGLAARFEQYERSWWRRTFTAGRDRRLLRGYLLDKTERLTFQQMAEDAQRLQMYARAMQWFAQHGEENEALFGAHYRGADTDWASLADLLAIAERLNGLLRDVGTSSRLQTAVTVSGIPTDGRARLADLKARIERSADSLKKLAEYFLCRGFKVSTPEDLGSIPILHIKEWADQHIAEFDEIDTWQRYRRTRDEAKQMGLAAWLDHFLGAPEQARDAQDLFPKSFCVQWLSEVHRAREALRSFTIEDIERIREEFKVRDQQAISDGALRVIQQVLAARGKVGGAAIGQMRTLRRELNKQRRHKPVRQLLSEIPELVQTLTPCMMMSPMTVSQYLASDRLQFDLVVFDEASQLKPEDALPAIMRASQLILAGDPKQLPPTTFFETTLEDASDDEITLDPLESVLDEADVWLRKRLLRWHYRSRHDILIAFSNHEFYENRLMTFPDAGSGEELGVRFVRCDDGVYDRGGSRTNQVEAQRVADLVAQIADAHPLDSIGVVAFSKAQEQAIWEVFEARAKSDARLENFLVDDGGPEPFFIKNLETVQGDERDTIIISVGYGRDAQGHLTMNFGPLNQVGGARRLNVAVTRARKRVILVSSITAHDIRPDVEGGAKLLRRYLDFAERGLDALTSESSATAEPDSPFEEAVRCALLNRGLDVRSQVGCGPYRIDLAVIDPEHPGRYLLGIECDGRTYHSSETARDRDRLREQVLQDRGWRLVRIWSTDWWQNPERQVERVLSAVEARAQKSDEAASDTEEIDTPNPEASAGPPLAAWLPSSPNAESQPTDSESPADEAPDYGFEPYVACEPGLRGDLDAFYRMAKTSAADLREAIRLVVKAESPVHFDVAMKRVTEAFGISRCGSKIRDLFERCVAAAQREGLLRRQGDFLWSVDNRPLAVRTNKGSASPRQISEFALEELALAISTVVKMAHGARQEDVIPEVARALGFARTGRDIRDRIQEAVSLAIKQDLVRRVGDDLLSPAS